MRVLVESLLNCPAELAWSEVRCSRLLVEVASPLVAIRPARGEKLPDRWEEGQTVRCRCYLLSLLPLGTRKVFFERIDDALREIQTRESDLLVRQWDHLIRIEHAGDGQCRYRDEIDLDAGMLTPVVWLFTRSFYRHRQRRWRAVAKRLVAHGADTISPLAAKKPE
jgi:hypothetical protein